MKSSMSLLVNHSHPYSQKSILQQSCIRFSREIKVFSELHRKVPLFMIRAGASLLFPKSLSLQQRRLEPADSARQMYNCGNKLDQNVSNFSTHIIRTISTAADTKPLLTQLPESRPNFLEGETSDCKFIPFPTSHQQFKPHLVRTILLNNNSHSLLFTKDVFLKSAMVSHSVGSKVVFPQKN